MPSRLTYADVTMMSMHNHPNAMAPRITQF